MLRRIALFIALNFLIVMTVVTILDFLNVGPYLTRYGLDLQALAIFSLIWGMVGALISLSLSRFLVKKMMRIKLISSRGSATEDRLMRMVERLVQKAGLPDMPEVGIFDNAMPNAFATGPSKRRSLVAVSTGLLDRLSDEELEAVLAHEISHIKNGDMITMTLLQGVVNAFVIFVSRALAYAAANFLGKDRNGRKDMSYLTYMLFTIAFEIFFMVLGSILVAFVSRKREFRADKGAAELLGAKPMISALRALESYHGKEDIAKNKPIAALMINSRKRMNSPFFRLFATHPPISERIQRLEQFSPRFASY